VVKYNRDQKEEIKVLTVVKYKRDQEEVVTVVKYKRDQEEVVTVVKRFSVLTNPLKNLTKT